MANGVSNLYTDNARLRVGHKSSGNVYLHPLHTLCTTLNLRDVSGRLSRLMTASSPGAFIAPLHFSPPAFSPPAHAAQLQANRRSKG